MGVPRVKSMHGGYPVAIGPGVLSRLEGYLDKAAGRGRVLVVYDANLFALHGSRIRRALGGRRRTTSELVIPSGERHKNVTTLGRVHDYLLGEAIARDDFILVCGGGVTSDLVGYAASSVLRGVRWGIVATTLLSMADASIGGKTGVNHRLGKNLIGAFWAPSFVVSDTSFLATLPVRQLTSGLAEIIKCAGLTGGRAIVRCERAVGGTIGDTGALEPLIRDAVACKAAIVAADEREAGRRVLLNFGHTFGHAIETSAGCGRLLHGEAVLLGLLAALELGEEMLAAASSTDRYRELVRRAVRSVPRRSLEAGRILESLTLDKKRRDADLRYVLLARPGRPVVRTGVSRRQVRSALNRMLRYYEAHGGKRDTHSGYSRT